jgi:hypothetical protein
VSTIFTAAIAIFGLVAGSVNTFNSYVGCDSQYKGILEGWKGVDSYLQLVDSTFCSNNCACYINTAAQTQFASNTAAASSYAQWIQNSNNGAIAFQNCSITAQSNVYTSYKGNQENNNYAIDQTLFSQYFAMLENKFNCTGLCTTTYTNPNTNLNTVMYKYLFTDINRYILNI